VRGAAVKRGFVSKHRGRRFRVLFVKPGSIMFRPPGAAETFECAGLMDPNRRTIKIDGGLDAAEERATIAHEVLHQLLDGSGLDLTEEQEEEVVTYLGAAVGAHVAANPGLWAYLIALGAVSEPGRR
jgi:Zn-dependent peptidase ImmA (M78 family)